MGLRGFGINMAQTTATSPATTVNDTTVGISAWTNPNNSQVSDNVYATNLLSDGEEGTATSNYLKATNFGFSIPSGSTINGILVEIEAKSSASTLTWTNVRAVKGGTISATTKAGTTNGITTTEAYSSIPTTGASTDLWGESWTAADINASTFGVVGQIGDPITPRSASIDHIRITIDYTEGKGGMFDVF